MSRRFSFAEYVVLAEDAAVKLEFLNGQVWAMAGGSPEHAAVAGNVVALLNPRVLVEVLSPSTEDYDRGDKLAHYQQIPSLQEIVFVAQGRQQIEVVRREADGSWSRHVSGEGESAELSSLGAELPVAKVYENPLAD